MTTVVSCLDVWDPAVVDIIRDAAPDTLKMQFASSYDDGEQKRLLSDAVIACAGWAAIPAEFVSAAPKLQFVSKWGIGIDRIDVEALKRRGIGLAITAGANSEAVAEHALMLILAASRRVTQVDAAMRRGVWLKAQMRAVCYQVRRKTVGLYGFGNIGRALARKLSGLECKIIYYDERRAPADIEETFCATYVSFGELLAQSDILSLHVPFTPETHNILNADAIARMKRGALLVNTARGELVDQDALYRALVSGQLRGAGLDAFVPEPFTSDHPLLTLDQVVMTPHTGGAVIDNVANVANIMIGNIMCFLDGRPIPRENLILAPMRAPDSGGQYV
jgi:phosphoglycerate dehydrogenase-like enzyme